MYILQNKELSISMIRTIFGQTCEALKYIHESKIIHGMLTSNAIYMVTSSYAKLGNFEYASAW